MPSTSCCPASSFRKIESYARMSAAMVTKEVITPAPRCRSKSYLVALAAYTENPEHLVPNERVGRRR